MEDTQGLFHGPPDCCRMESLISGCQHLALEKMKVGKKLWAENIKINSQIVGTFDSVLCYKLELSIISTTMKIKLFEPLKKKDHNLE